MHDSQYAFWLEDIYYIRTSVSGEENKLYQESIKKFFLAALYYHKFIYDYKIYGYAVLDHMVHFIIHVEGKYPVSKIVQQIKGSFAREYNKINHKKESFWEHGYYSAEINNVQQLAQTLNHIHFSPLKMEDVYNISEFPFSSIHHYLGKEEDYLIDDFILDHQHYGVLHR